MKIGKIMNLKIRRLNRYSPFCEKLKGIKMCIQKVGNTLKKLPGNVTYFRKIRRDRLSWVKNCWFYWIWECANNQCYYALIPVHKDVIFVLVDLSLLIPIVCRRNATHCISPYAIVVCVCVCVSVCLCVCVCVCRVYETQKSGLR